MKNSEKAPSKKKSGSEDAAAGTIDARKLLLSRVAGDVASGIMTAPSKSVGSAAEVAEVAVDVAEEILKRVGL